MRKILVLTFMSLDGVMQAPGAPEEDLSDGFKFGGWSAPYDDEVLGEAMRQQMAPTDLLLGRKTFEIFESYWPKHADYWPGINESTKYVLSNTLKTSDWENTVFLTSVEDVEKLKNSDGPDLKVWGSSKLAQMLLKHDLVDELWLKIYPVLLGKGKKIFNDDAFPAALTVTASVVTPGGVIVVNYKRAGDVKTGRMGPQE